MAVHDWTRVTAGVFHDFHVAWIVELRRALNGGVLPEGYYAQAELVAGQVIADVLTLEEFSEVGPRPGAASSLRELNGGVSVVETPPQVALSDTITEAMLLAARRRQLVIRHTTGERIVALLEIVSPGKPLTLAAYASAGAITCNIEPTAIGAELIPMPLFLDPGHYVNVPLNPTYLAAYESVPRRWKQVIESVKSV